jgi:HK97 family phage portal protein
MVFNKLFEQRGAYQTAWANGDSDSTNTLSAVVINEENILTVNAVFSAVSLIADTISTLPIDVFIRRNGARFPFRPAPAWVYQPDIDLPKEAFYSGVITSLLLDGNAFIRIFSNAQGEIVNMVVLNPQTVTIKRNGLGRLQFNVVGEDKPLSAEEVVFIPDLIRPGEVRGVSRVEALKENFALGLAMERFSSTFFGSGTNLSGVITTAASLTSEQAQELAAGFDARHRGWKRGHRTGVLSGGASWTQTQTDPEKSSLIDSRNQAIADVARAFNVPPHLLALPGTNSYASVEQTNLAWVTHGLRPVIQKIEGAISPLMSRYQGGESAFIKFNLDGLLRADIQTRNSAYSTGLQSGYLSINDVRRWEDLTPVENASADTVRVPLANVNIDAATLTAESERVKMAQMLIISGFNPAEVLKTVGLDPIDHTGLPSTQLQQVSTVNVENPSAVYADKVQ